MKLKIILLFLYVFMSFLVKAQSDGFFTCYLSHDYKRFVQHIYFNHINARGNVVYTLQTNDYKVGDFKQKVELIEQDAHQEILRVINLDKDSLKVFTSYGRAFNGNIGIISVARTQLNFYIVYRLFDEAFNELQYNLFFLDEYSADKLSGLDWSFNAYELETNSNVYVTINHPIRTETTSLTPRFLGYKFDHSGYLSKIAPLNFHDAVYWDKNNNELIFGTLGSSRSIYDEDLNFIRKENIYNLHSGVHDTIIYLYNSFVAHNDKNYFLGKVDIIYDQFTDSVSFLRGRLFSEIDDTFHPKERCVVTPVPASGESDGVARFGPTTFYRDGLIYTLFEYRDYTYSGPWVSTFLLTTFDTLLNIVEETHFRIDEDYKFFIEYCSLSEENQFCVSGFCYYFNQVADSTQLGAYVLCMNKDGSQPPLSAKEEPVISSIIKVRGNPTSDYLRLYTEDFDRPAYRITVTDMKGRPLVSNLPWSDPEQNIDVRNFSPGIYVYTIHHGNSVVLSGKFVKI